MTLTFMENRTGLHNTPREARRGKRLLAAFLMLSAPTLFSCSNKGASPNAPGAAPVVQISPDTPGAPSPVPSPARKLFRTGEVVPAGYLGYKVYSSWFTDHLPNGAGKSPASFLFVDLSVVNTDKKERPIGPLKLVDESGKETALSVKGSTVDQSVGQIKKLEPSVSKRVVAIFEVPSGHTYKLRIQGFTTADEITIDLSPTAAPPSP